MVNIILARRVNHIVAKGGQILFGQKGQSRVAFPWEERRRAQDSYGRTPIQRTLRLFRGLDVGVCLQHHHAGQERTSPQARRGKEIIRRFLRTAALPLPKKGLASSEQRRGRYGMPGKQQKRLFRRQVGTAIFASARSIPINRYPVLLLSRSFSSPGRLPPLPFPHGACSFRSSPSWTLRTASEFPKRPHRPPREA